MSTSCCPPTTGPATSGSCATCWNVDPRQDGGRINDITVEALVERISIGGGEWLHYKAMPIHVALLRGTTADPAGNVTMEREALTLDNLAMAMAAKNSNGVVIVQVERIAERGSLHPRAVKLPAALVDCLVEAPPELHQQTFATAYSPAFSAEIRAPLASRRPMPLDARKIIAPHLRVTGRGAGVSGECRWRRDLRPAGPRRGRRAACRLRH